jgi:low affinity Fe/Cu permease
MRIRSTEKPSLPQRRRIEHRTSQLPIWSRLLYKIEHYTFLPVVALIVTATAVAFIVVIAALGYPDHWVATFELSATSLTLVMVFAIQHTQGREQAASQRKLDELIRAVPRADESFMMLEEAPQQVLLQVEHDQRNVRLNSTETSDD